MILLTSENYESYLEATHLFFLAGQVKKNCNFFRSNIVVYNKNNLHTKIAILFWKFENNLFPFEVLKREEGKVLNVIPSVRWEASRLNAFKIIETCILHSHTWIALHYITLRYTNKNIPIYQI